MRTAQFALLAALVGIATARAMPENLGARANGNQVGSLFARGDKPAPPEHKPPPPKHGKQPPHKGDKPPPPKKVRRSPSKGEHPPPKDGKKPPHKGEHPPPPKDGKHGQ